MKVREVMTEAVRTVRPNTTLAAAGIEMLRHDCGALPVVDPDRGVVGMITDRDICIALATRDLPASAITVGEVVSQRVCSVGADEPHAHALELMRAAQVRRLPVLDDEANIVGIVSIGDLVAASAREAGEVDEPTYDEVMRAIKGISRRWNSLTLEVLHASLSVDTALQRQRN